MPAPARTDRDRIVAVGCALLDEGGPDAVTMHAVAERVGVRAPSLYKHVRDRNDLLVDVVAATAGDLAARLEAVGDVDPGRALVAQAEALRRFSRERPHGYGVVFGVLQGVPRPEPDTLARALRPLLRVLTESLGEEHALDGARLFTAWANGFITMELAGALRMGGDVDAAWEWGLRRIVAALRPAEAPARRSS